MAKLKNILKYILRKLHLYNLAYKVWHSLKKVYINLIDELRNKFYESFESF